MSDPNLSFEESPSRYVVGIDLGTTNSAICFIDTESVDWQVQTFAIDQLVATGEVDARETLPSFHFQPVQAEGQTDAYRLPWQKKPEKHVVGSMARDEGSLAPGRMIASAKSWLCHAGVDRTAEILPWHGTASTYWRNGGLRALIGEVLELGARWFGPNQR